MNSAVNLSIVNASSALPAGDIKKTIDLWRNWGVELSRPSGIKLKKDILSAHSLETRVEELKAAFSKKESGEFVWALRGGYGLHETLPFLKAADFKAHKVFMGFSDCTALHYYLNQNLDQASLHSSHPNVFLRILSKKLMNDLNGLLRKPKNFSPVFRGLKYENQVRKKNFKAKIIGGNLTTLVSLIGTPFDKGSRGKILFLEELEEPAYKINRMLTHMEQACFLKGVKAVVFGHMIHESKGQEALIKKVIKRWALKQSFPVLSGMQAGHIHQKNNAFWLGKKSELLLDEKPRLLNNV